MTRAYKDDIEPGDLSVADTGPEVVVEDLDRQDFVRYAGASGDFNPVHYDEPYAEAAGYPGVFGQGMLTAGFAAHATADWFGLSNIERLRTRFRSKVWPGDTITVTTQVTEVTTIKDGDRVEASIQVRNQNDELVLTGSVNATITE